MSRSVALATRLTLVEAADVVGGAFALLHGRVEAIATVGPEPEIDGPATLAVLGRREALLNTWAVQAYFYDLGGTRGVELVALGETGLLRVVGGVGRLACLSRSMRRMDAVVAALRDRDPLAQLIA